VIAPFARFSRDRCCGVCEAFQLIVPFKIIDDVTFQIRAFPPAYEPDIIGRFLVFEGEENLFIPGIESAGCPSRVLRALFLIVNEYATIIMIATFWIIVVLYHALPPSKVE
jgi:hypothetical protein